MATAADVEKEVASVEALRGFVHREFVARFDRTVALAKELRTKGYMRRALEVLSEARELAKRLNRSTERA
jgi:hypothetical protein